MFKILATLSMLIAFVTSFSTEECPEKSVPSCGASPPDYQERRKVDGMFPIIRKGELIIKYCRTEILKPRKIDLSHRGISKLSKDFATIPSLKRMNLEHNCLEEIAANAFKGLGDLEELNLAANKISKVHPNAFDGLGKLYTLNLNYNKITEISWSISISNLPALEELFLAHNELTTFERSDTNHSPDTNIIRLDLTGNCLSVFEYSSPNAENNGHNKFYRFRNLTELYLADNQIEEFSSPDLALETAVFDNNKLKAFPRLHQNAKFVSLNKNEIVCESLSELSNIPSVAYLQLGANNFNGLRCIATSNNPFDSLQLCSYLTLENNELTTIQEILPQNLPQLEYLSVGNNELPCIDVNKMMEYVSIQTVEYSGNPVPNSIEGRFCEPVKNDTGREFRLISAEDYYSEFERNFFKYNWNPSDKSVNFLID